MFLLIKLERYAKLNINGKYDANSITLTFSDDQINSLLSDYLNLKGGKLDGFTDYDFDYDTVVNDLMINIEKTK